MLINVNFNRIFSLKSTKNWPKIAIFNLSYLKNVIRYRLPPYQILIIGIWACSVQNLKFLGTI